MRKTKIVTITDEGRDKGKTFRIEEWPASRLEEWATRALIAIFSGNVPADVLQISKTSNAAALVSTGLTRALQGLSWETVQPLYRELLSCVAFVPDRENKANPANFIPLTSGNVDNFVEEAPTLYRLRLEVLELNLGFFGAGGGLFSRLTQENSPKD